MEATLQKFDKMYLNPIQEFVSLKNHLKIVVSLRVLYGVDHSVYNDLQIIF